MSYHVNDLFNFEAIDLLSSQEAISSFRNKQKMLFVYEYCLICCNKCLIFIGKQEKRTCQHVRHISVSNTTPRQKGPLAGQ